MGLKLWLKLFICITYPHNILAYAYYMCTIEIMWKKTSIKSIWYVFHSFFIFWRRLEQKHQVHRNFKTLKKSNSILWGTIVNRITSGFQKKNSKTWHKPLFQIAFLPNCAFLLRKMLKSNIYKHFFNPNQSIEKLLSSSMIIPAE